MTGVRKKKWFKKEDLPLYVMASPTVLWLLIFCYAPILGLVMAFQNLNITAGILGSDFVGLKNFKFLFTTTDAWIITRNTVCYNVVFIIVNMILAVLMALLHRDYGMVNRLMIALGKQEGKVDYYTKRELWPPLLVLINAWKGVGYQTVLYLAVISGISTDYYEAAVLDGATKRQQAWYITIPHLRMVISISIIMAMGSIFRGDFGLFYVVTKDTGRLYPVTDVIDTYIYRALTRLSNVGMATASGMYQSVVGLFMVLGVNAIVNRIDPDSAMF